MPTDAGKTHGRYSVIMRERAVQTVLDQQHEYASQWKAIKSIGERLGVHRETLRAAVRRAEADGGTRSR
jgi:transposase